MPTSNFDENNADFNANLNQKEEKSKWILIGIGSLFEVFH